MQSNEQLLTYDNFIYGIRGLRCGGAYVRSPKPSGTRIEYHSDRQTPFGPVKTRINKKDGAVMIFIRAGRFLMGESGLPYDSNPRRTVTLPGFWIYKNVVTVGMYKRFCRKTGRLIK